MWTVGVAWAPVGATPVSRLPALGCPGSHGFRPRRSLDSSGLRRWSVVAGFRRLGPRAPVRTSRFEMLQAEGQHREHAVVEQVIADAAAKALAHLPPLRPTPVRQLVGSLAAQVGQARGASALLGRGRSRRQRVNVALTTLTVLVPRRALSSRTPTSRCRSASAGRRVRARESPPGAGRAATGTRVALRSRPPLPARQHERP
jgi:hypothetical protein